MPSNTTTKPYTAPGLDPGATHTTFVQADPSTFRALVQKLTGATEGPSAEKLPVTSHPSRQPTKTTATAALIDVSVGPRRPAFKLQERRQNVRKLEITLAGTAGAGGSRFRSFKCGSSGEASNLLVSPVSPFDVFSRGGSPRTPRSPYEEEEEKAIAEKGFYLHPSPLNTPRSSEPELLPLFPLHSPRESTSS